MTARPFLRFVGGKTKLLPEIRKHIPKRFGTYHEPFVGGGALFFDIKEGSRSLTNRDFDLQCSATISDGNPRLMRTYAAIKHNVQTVIDLLKGMSNTQGHFNRVRQQHLDSATDAEVAAWFIYLNRTCFNGLYRVNSRDQFNVPYGHRIGLDVCDARMEGNLREVAVTLTNTTILHESFVGILNRARKNDFVFFDPPYLPISTTSKFTSYTAGGFGLRDHTVLRDIAKHLKTRGVQVLLSNVDCPAVRDLYGDFEIHEVFAPRSINSVGTGRGNVRELLIR
jgi:DNA adenine methylase